MCRNIKTLFNFDPPATEAEIFASALQFVRKISGYQKPSKVNEEAFQRAIDKVGLAARELIDSLVTNSPPKNREDERVKARRRIAQRYRQPQ
ncbi:hypothetical protein D1AOALGA4SA_7574 [Olavius algarvensis Delta 1 endosymbiont]|nr:hypothetical protein D1AOALGA4SA_7574 [Olavius algarvensis Delta 1 endosymbiont]